MTLQEKLEQRKKLVEQGRAIHAKSVEESRSLTGEEQAEFDKVMSEADTLGDQIAEETRSIENAKRVEDAAKSLEERGHRQTGATNPERAESTKAEDEYRKAYQSYILKGEAYLASDERRALSAGIATEGGYLIPQSQQGPFIQAIDNVSWMRQLSTVYSVTGADRIDCGTLDTDVDDADWTSELGTGSEDSAMKIGNRSLTPHPYAKRIKISKDLLAKVPAAEGMAMSRLAYKCGITEEKAFLTGIGSQNPLGIFTAHANGVSTSRDVSSGNTTTAITADGLMNAYYSLRLPYRRNGAWLFHRDAIKSIRTLKFSIGSDNVGYVWEPSLKAGEPDMILGRPVYESEYAPNTFTTGLYVGMFADFSYYWVADGSSLVVQRLSELYAETNQVGLIVRRHVDGRPVLAEAFARVKLA